MPFLGQPGGGASGGVPARAAAAGGEPHQGDAPLHAQQWVPGNPAGGGRRIGLASESPRSERVIQLIPHILHQVFGGLKSIRLGGNRNHVEDLDDFILEVN